MTQRANVRGPAIGALLDLDVADLVARLADDAARRGQSTSALALVALLQESGGKVAGVLHVLRDGPRDLQCEAIDVLVSLGRRSLARELVDALASDILCHDVRKALAFGIGLLGGKSAARRLRRLAVSAHASEVREAAILALGWLSDRGAVPVLESIVRDQDMPASERSQACESLGIILGTEQHALRALHDALGDSEPSVRFWAAYAIGEIGDKTAVPLLEQVARDDHAPVEGWWPVSHEAARVLGGLRGDWPDDRLLAQTDPGPLSPCGRCHRTPPDAAPRSRTRTAR